MGLRITSIGSSSSGNAYVIQSAGCALLLDTGLSGKKIRAGIAELGLSEKDIRGIFITHEHTDHVNSVRVMSKVCDRAQIYTSRGTVFSSEKFSKIDETRIEYLIPGDEFDLEDIRVRSFSLSHDASEPIGYSFESNGDRLTVVTDTGVVTEEIFAHMLESNKLVFEANHEEQLLLFGPYPYTVKRRILSDVGHLSNLSSGETLARLLKERKRADELKIMLAHLSPNNNTPSQARYTVTETLAQHGFERNRDYIMDIALKEGLSVLD